MEGNYPRSSAKVFASSAPNGAVFGKIDLVDATDCEILAELQREGRQTITDLAAKVGLSISPCHRRLRELERTGVITGYRAQVSAAAVGLGFEALLFVTMRQEDRETLLGFERAVARIPNVVQAQRLFGDPDYLLRILTTDLQAYQQLEDDVLGTLPGVQRLTSTLVMKRVVDDRAVPVTPR
jgi:DNA-binding Lrp family transcriptional regulator